MHTPFTNVLIMNMAMIYDVRENCVLLQDRKKRYFGGAFPGGHFEAGESVYGSCVREIFEETGLEVTSLVPCGFAHWNKKEGTQEFIYFYRTGSFSGELIQSDEGTNRWVKLEELKSQNLAGWFKDQLPIFFTNTFTELTYVYDTKNDKYIKKFFGAGNMPSIDKLPSFLTFNEQQH